MCVLALACCMHSEPDGGEHIGALTLQEQDLVVGGNVHQLAQVLLGLLDHGLELLAAVAHLHDAHASALVVDEVLLRLL